MVRNYIENKFVFKSHKNIDFDETIGTRKKYKLVFDPKLNSSNTVNSYEFIQEHHEIFKILGALKKNFKLKKNFGHLKFFKFS